MRLRVAAAVVNQVPLDWNGNLDSILALIKTAKHQGVQLLSLPELCISGYHCEDTFYSVHTTRASLEILFEIIEHSRDLVISVGLPVEYDGKLYNAMACIVDRRLAALFAKRFLANAGIHYEQRWFHPWPRGRQSKICLGMWSVPIGDLCLDVSGVRIGYEICEDAWVADRPIRRLAAVGVDIVLNPSASHFAFGKYDLRRRMITEGSRASGSAIIYSNLLGCEAGRAVFDGDAMIVQNGVILEEGPRFRMRKEAMIITNVDLDAIHTYKRMYVHGVDTDASMTVIPATFDWHDKADSAHWSEPSPKQVSHIAQWSAGSNRYEEFWQAEALGLFDYLRKTKSRGFVVSLSGGADSSLTAILVYLMTVKAVQTFGPDELREIFPWLSIDEGNEEDVIRQIMPQMLVCVYQKTRNNREETLLCARDISSGIDAKFYLVNMDSIIDGYLDIMRPVLGRRLDWKTDDIALQNIQARARVPSIWLLANVKGALLLNTSNRSEAAVGYATMDGDTSGGLAPLAGIDKAFILQWLKWAEETGPQCIGKMPFLRRLNQGSPSAELRPIDAGQKDEDDLMPYDVLDFIEKAAIRDKRPPADVLDFLQNQFGRIYSNEKLIEWTRKFFVLWSRNQWKRERYAPSFHLDDENLDPKSWCRFPIFSSGYADELRKLGSDTNGQRPDRKSGPADGIENGRD